MINSVYSSYHYVGCYKQVFYHSYFTSSYMEPTLCFLLCETPIIYIQDTICRCSGGGFMDHNRQQDELCTISCRKPGNTLVKTVNTCGGRETYSVYAEEKFYIQHAHLFNFRIQFTSCEFWNKTGYYNVLQVKIDKLSIKTPLNKLERCAAACLDQNTTTKSIAFNDDNNQCLCIMAQKLNPDSDSARYLTILSNNSCDRYCDNTLDDSKVEHKFQCGSSKDPRIWAVYDLNATCPIGSIYIKELKKCMSTYKGISNICPSPSINYIYNGNLTWNIFLKIIGKLNLTKSIVSIDFDNYVTIDSSWMCSTTTINTINSNLSNRNFSTYYVLDNGCLRVRSYSLSSHILSNRLCITNPINENPLSYGTRFYSYYTLDSNRILPACPPQWLDINGHCYRISDDRKTIQEARNSCITLPKDDKYSFHLHIISVVDDYANKNDDMKETIGKYKNHLIDIFKGEIAQYTLPWQARLGFFLLDTNASNTGPKFEPYQSISLYMKDASSLVSNVDVNLSSINEFQMINPNDDNSLSIKDDSCLLWTRSIIDEKQRSSILEKIQINNCSKPRHVLCRTKTMLGFNSPQICYTKPSTLGLPIMISNHLTYELCLSVCKTLKTNLAVINMNKCYCFDATRSQILDPKRNHAKYETQDCGDPCPGMFNR
ncbi:unnamed protein product [Rotaria sordida]|uniref:WSC domain-containing protein n=1 Tax=Rotaria sordida TaxID=392033 RepID=A0A819LD61_9BILA|nr:unnamed protein product [Rotaria sordida]